MRFRSRLSSLGTLLFGVLALAWILLRSGMKPSRLSYPCQQSALGVAFASISLPLGLSRIGTLRRGSRRAGAFVPVGLLLGGAVATAILLVFSEYGAVYTGSVETPPVGYEPEIFLVNDARGPTAASFGGVDDLVSLMGGYGFKWHRSGISSRTAGPEGLIGTDDVVLIKINAQWSERGGTNTDVLRGLIRNIVSHPDGFTGEVVVADNGQGSGSLTRALNNAEDHAQSPKVVADEFAGAGWNVSTFLWDAIRQISVEEFDTGDMRDGYVVSATPDPETAVRVSYPKFRTAGGHYVSYRFGTWNQTSESYESDRLVVINAPVLKTHSIYAVTAAVKNHMGVITQSLSTDSHNGVGRGGLGSVMANVRMPDLTVLDAVWILARPGAGPSASYSAASRCDKLIAGADPVALDAWAVKHVLLPQIIANGYTFDQYGSMQDPNNASSKFRQYLDRSMDELLRGGRAVSNDYVQAKIRRWAGDADHDGDLDLFDTAAWLDCRTGPAQTALPDCRSFSFTADDSVDLADFAAMQALFTGS